MNVDDLLGLSKVPPTKVLNYGTASEQFAHLYLPESSGPHPVAILIHGGCWRDSVSLDYFGQAAKALSHLGIAVWNLEYRRLGNGGGWPMTFLDVALAADSLRELSQDYQLDLSRLIAIGHSAGGHLAHWLAARYKLSHSSDLYRENPLAITGFISLAGIPDLAEALKQEICQNAAVSQLMGGSAETVPLRYQAGSPAELAPLQGKQVFIQGRQDDTVHLHYIQHYVHKARARGEPISLIELENTGHFELVTASTSQWKIVEAAVSELLELRS